MSEQFVVPNQEKLDQSQQEYMGKAAVDAYLALGLLSDQLTGVGVHIIQVTVAIDIPGAKSPKLVNVARPGMPPDALRQLLELLGKESIASVAQAEIVEAMARERVNDIVVGKCAECPDKGTCDKRVSNDRVH